MKKLKLASLFLAGVMLVGCSNDDNNGPQTNGDLTARWNPDKVLREIGNDDQTTPYDGHEPGCEKDFVQFNDDNTVTIAEYTTVFGNCQQNVDPTVTTFTRPTNDPTRLIINGSVNYQGDYEIIMLNNSDLRIQKVDNVAGSEIKTTIFFKKAANQGS